MTALRLGTRASALATTQSRMIARQIEKRTGIEVRLVTITTEGDTNTAPLTSLGGVGVFVGAVREALLAGRVDLAVHSFKDLPTAPAKGIELLAVPTRADPRDAWCSTGASLRDIRQGARVGTGSPRRAAQVLVARSDVQIVPIRGNVDTRLGRVGTDLDAVVLAAAGLTRLGHEAAITEYLDFLPAPAQGALAVECRSELDDRLRAVRTAIDDATTRNEAIAERAVLSTLEAGCAAPVGARVVAGNELTIDAAVFAVDGSRTIAERLVAISTQSPTEAGAEVARRLLARGAADLMNDAR